MSTANLKQAAHYLIDQLPEEATWDDVVYEMVTRREIEAGLADSEAHRTTPAEDVQIEFGLKALRFTGRTTPRHALDSSMPTSPKTRRWLPVRSSSGRSIAPSRSASFLTRDAKSPNTSARTCAKYWSALIASSTASARSASTSSP